jgi:hypothetical protein
MLENTFNTREYILQQRTHLVEKTPCAASEKPLDAEALDRRAIVERATRAPRLVLFGTVGLVPQIDFGTVGLVPQTEFGTDLRSPSPRSLPTLPSVIHATHSHHGQISWHRGVMGLSFSV